MIIDDRVCPCCGNTEFKKDDREIFCNHCGLIIDEKPFIQDQNQWETSHAKLGNGLDLITEMVGIEKKCGFTNPNKKRYLNFKQNYYDKFIDKLLGMGYTTGEALDIFNYSFKQWYNENIPPTNRRSRDLIIDDYLNSLSFERVNIKAFTPSITYDLNRKVLNYYDNVRIIL